MLNETLLSVRSRSGAGDGNRTHDIQLGKLSVSQSPQELDCKTRHFGGQSDQRVARGSQNQAPHEFPIVVAQWARNARDVVRVALKLYLGKHTINARVWYRNGAALKPSESGITLAVKHLPALAEAMGKALDGARDLGLLTERGEQ